MFAIPAAISNTVLYNIIKHILKFMVAIIFIWLQGGGNLLLTWEEKNQIDFLSTKKQTIKFTSANFQQKKKTISLSYIIFRIQRLEGKSADPMLFANSALCVFSSLVLKYITVPGPKNSVGNCKYFNIHCNINVYNTILFLSQSAI